MWRHNYDIGRNEYLISTLSEESTVPYVYSLQFLFKSTKETVSGLFFLNSMYKQTMVIPYIETKLMPSGHVTHRTACCLFFSVGLLLGQGHTHIRNTLNFLNVPNTKMMVQHQCTTSVKLTVGKPSTIPVMGNCNFCN